MFDCVHNLQKRPDVILDILPDLPNFLIKRKNFRFLFFSRKYFSFPLSFENLPFFKTDLAGDHSATQRILINAY